MDAHKRDAYEESKAPGAGKSRQTRSGFVSAPLEVLEEQKPPTFLSSWVERDMYSRGSELTHQWALAIVEDAVNRKIKNYCYPIIQGQPSKYKAAWGFEALLGAMWLQMM